MLSVSVLRVCTRVTAKNVCAIGMIGETETVCVQVITHDRRGEQDDIDYEPVKRVCCPLLALCPFPHIIWIEVTSD